ncbi:MAG: glycosyltransferase family 4 protein [Blastocatellia bacterium]
MLAILTTHPIQYQVPLWQALAQDGRVPFEVWYLTRHGIEVSPDREFGQSFAWDLDTLQGYPHRFLNTASEATPASFWKCRMAEPLADLLRSRGVRALWVQGWQVAAYWQAVWAAKRAGVDVWLRGESNDLAPTPRAKQALKRRLLGQFFQRVDHFLFIGAANRRLYEQFGVPASRLHPAPYAVDNERFKEQADHLRSQRAELRKQWGIAEDAFCILFCGKFIPKKRPLDLVAAAHQLKQQGRVADPHLLFVGSGELGERLRSECTVVFDAESNERPSVGVNNHSARPRASFVGFLNQTEISQAYVAADCLVLPSDHRETWGLVINEALVSGLPCVVSDACGCAEDLIKPFNSHLCFPLGEPSQLAEALERLAAYPAEMNNVDQISETYNFARSVRTVAEIYLACHSSSLS